MVRTRKSPPPELPPEGPPGGSDRPDGGRHRLNLLLSYGGWRQTPAEEQLARLLEPMGINSITADSGEEAAEVIRTLAVHIAVVDMAIPFDRRGSSPAPGGGRILQLLRRLEQPPPTVLVRPPQPASRESVRQLSEALREGAFAVLDRPFHLETMLEVMRRVLRRHYADLWPDTA
ncbi:MAG: hypothetical protein SYC29_17765 [Planctomycetota bacterium]|nr:hypothetical protein [Planctomycetota bacterium]